MCGMRRLTRLQVPQSVRFAQTAELLFALMLMDLMCVTWFQCSQLLLCSPASSFPGPTTSHPLAHDPPVAQ